MSAKSSKERSKSRRSKKPGIDRNSDAAPCPIAPNPLDEIIKAIDDEESCFDEHRRARASAGKISELQKRLSAAFRTIDRLEAEFELISNLAEITTKPPQVVVPSSKTNHAIPLFIWSDWHVEERVAKSKVRGLNEYTPDIATERARKCVQSTVKLIRHVRNSSHVDSVSLFLGGDWISGDIHEELSQTNLLGPIDATVLAMNLIREGLATIAAERYLKKIHVSCVVGNHGRTTHKMQFKNGTEKSFESFIYAVLAKEFSSTKFDWQIAAGGINYVELADGFVVRDFHGHQVKYGGGVGGLTIPLNKWLSRQDATQHADFNRMGHYHNFSTPTANTLLNGSLKGWDEYASEKGFLFEPPTQACAVYDCGRRRISGIHPVYCE